MKRPSPEDIERAKRLIMQAQTEERNRGMPSTPGLLYQPIPFEEFNDFSCERDSTFERLDLIREHIDFEGLRLLDLGCANGFFLQALADKIQFGLGVDRYHGNVSTAKVIADTFGINNIQFEKAEITLALIEELIDQEFDVCLFLSVHHHLLRDLGIEQTKKIVETLCTNIPVVVIEQGSLTQDEYEIWTGRKEVFTTSSFSRLYSMIECLGLHELEVGIIGQGMYLSGERPDEHGAPRAIVAVGQQPNHITEVTRKYHKNGIVMELLTIVGPEPKFVKNVVAGSSLAHRERKFLTMVEKFSFAPRLKSFYNAVLELEYLELVPIPDVIDVVGPQIIRNEMLNVLFDLARVGIVHNELTSEHLLWCSAKKRVMLVDYETAWEVGEDRQEWREAIFETNPAIGMGFYARELLLSHPFESDLASIQVLFATWNLAPLTDEESQQYLSILRESL